MNSKYYKIDDHKAICDICGRAYKGSELRMQWDRIMACRRCFDTKHPDLDPIIAPREDPGVYDARPRPSQLKFVDNEGLSAWDGVMFNGVNMGTEWTWDEMNVNWDESASIELEDLH